MTKEDLIKVVADNSGSGVAEVRNVYNALAAACSEELRSTGETNLPGIAKFKIAERAARPGRNPKTGEVIQIPARKVVTAKPLAPFSKL